VFLVLLCSIALFSSRWWLRRHDGNEAEVVSPGMRRWVTLTTGMILLQLTVGAAMRHQHAGLAVPDFPLAYGKIWPDMDAASVDAYNRARLDARDFNPVTAGQIGLHMAHRILALVIVSMVILLGWRAARHPGTPTWMRRGAKVWLGLIGLQAVLGVATIWSNKAADVATAHVLLGAVSLAWGGMMAIVCRKFSVDAARRVGHPALDFSEANSNRPKSLMSARQA
jgi:cytochrome c oxidase assembly protein subunit 15